MRDTRVIAITVDGEPADRRTLELLERGIEALTKAWDAAYEMLADEMPALTDISTLTVEHVVAYHNELLSLSSALNQTLVRQMYVRMYGAE